MSEEPKNGADNNSNNDKNQGDNQPIEVIATESTHHEPSDNHEPSDKNKQEESPPHIYSNAPETEGYSTVSATTNTKRLMLIGIVIFAIIGLYFVFFSDFLKAPKEKEAEVKIPQKEVEKAISEATPVTGGGQPESSTTTAATTTEAPALIEPTLPEPPPPPEAVIPETPEFDLSKPTMPINVGGGGGKIFGASGKSAEEIERIKAKRAEKIMVMGAGKGAESTAAKGEGTTKEGEEEKEGEEGKKKEKETKEEPKKPSSSFLGFGDGKIGARGLERTSAIQVAATSVGDMNNIIAQGKIIAATLETAINTDIPGMLRAIIARDVYSEAGKRILIPKGSRAIGEYEPEVKNGQTRINVIWNRIITPSGIDIALTSPGTDELGRAGIRGKLDNKFWTKMLSAVMISFVIPLIAYKAVNRNGNNPQEITNESVATDGTVSVTTTTDTKNQLLKQSIDKFSEVATEIVKSSLPEKPTITVPQGEKINIFVNKDLVFPDASLLLETRVIK